MSLILNKDPHDIFFRCVEDSSEAIMITDIDGKLVYVNPAWLSIYGYDEREVIGATPKLLHSGHHKKEFYDGMWVQILNPKIGHWKGEVINRAKNGKLIPVLLTITPYRSSNGLIKGYMGLAIDIEEKKELKAQLIHQDRLASIGALASGLAHEIGTPLGVIRGRAEMLAMNSSADDSMKSSISVITSQIDRISKLIRSLLKVSRSSPDLKIAPVAVKQVVDEVLLLVEKDLKLSGILPVLYFETESLVLADFDRLEQVILNLVMNAIHAMKLLYEKNVKREHKLMFRLYQQSGKVILKVTDTGCGIPEANMQKLFQPFFTTKETSEGTGLGLAIVAQLVHEIGAEISVESIAESTEMQGTTFTIVFNPA